MKLTLDTETRKLRIEDAESTRELDLYSKEARNRLFQQTGTEAEVLPPLLSATGSEWGWGW